MPNLTGGHAPASACSRPLHVFLAGATGVIGMRLLPLLIAAGHAVAGMTRSQDKAGQLQRSELTPSCATYSTPPR